MTTIHAPAPSNTAPTRRWWALGFVLTGNVAVFAAVTMMNVALPAAQESLGMSVQNRQWVVTLYSLCFGAFMLLGGRLADILGLRRCFTAGMLGFATASLLGGLATNPALLLAARALQGVTGALVAATALAIISVMFAQGRDRARAFAVFGIVMGMGTAASFMVAGALVDWVSWRWCMLIHVPLALIVAFGVTRTAPRTATSGRERIGLPSAILVTVAIGLLVYGFDRTATGGWAQPLVWALLAGAVLALGLFAVALRQAARPLIPPRLLADRQRATAFFAVFVVGIGMFAGMYILTTFLQDILGYSPLLIGLAFLPFGVSAYLTSKLLTAWARMPAGTMLAAGLALVAGAIATFLALSPSSAYVTGILPAMLLLGAGGTIVMVTGSNAATFGAGTDSGVASAVVNSGQQIGAALGTALLTSIMAAIAQRHGGSDLEASLAGYGSASAVGAVIIAASALLVFFLARAK